jgi:16S rRNA (guanine527-N7)-methyltransferase
MSAMRSDQEPDPQKLAADKARALALTPVSRETLKCLEEFVEALFVWQRRTNLVANSTLSEVWTRHISDSLQLLPLAPDARVFADLGSGAGFPGLVIACALKGQDGALVHLVESTGKKANFLREVIRITGAPAVVHQERIENFAAKSSEEIDAVTARALAPLPQLLELSAPLLKSGVLGLFPKGQDVEAELTSAAKSWSLRYDLAPSVTNPAAKIVIVRELQRKA